MSLKLLLVLTGAAMLGLGAEATASSPPWANLSFQQQTVRQQIWLYHSEHARFRGQRERWPGLSGECSSRAGT